MDRGHRLTKESDELSIYSKHLHGLIKNPKHFGRMNDPTAAAFIKGPCGDEMEFYLVIENDIIKEAKFYSEGCPATMLYGDITVEMSIGKSIDEVLSISPKQIASKLEGIPEYNSHCSILAVSTIHRAIAGYLLKK